MTQYDINLLHSIEEVTENQLSAFEADESAALKNITKIYAARRAAAMRIAEEESLGKGPVRRKKKRSGALDSAVAG